MPWQDQRAIPARRSRCARPGGPARRQSRVRLALPSTPRTQPISTSALGRALLPPAAPESARPNPLLRPGRFYAPGALRVPDHVMGHVSRPPLGGKVRCPANHHDRTWQRPFQRPPLRSEGAARPQGDSAPSEIAFLSRRGALPLKVGSPPTGSDAGPATRSAPRPRSPAGWQTARAAASGRPTRG